MATAAVLKRGAAAAGGETARNARNAERFRALSSLMLWSGAAGDLYTRANPVIGAKHEAVQH